MSCEDDKPAVSREDALAMLLAAAGIQEGRGWLPAVIPNEQGKLFFHYDRIPLPLHNNPYFPFPEIACKEIDKKALDTIMGSAWAKMAKMPLFASVLMPVPTLATMLTGIKSNADVEEFENGIKELDELYVKSMNSRNMSPEEFYETEEARTILDVALMAKTKRDAQLRTHNLHVPIGWERYVSSVSIYLYYSRIIDILATTSAFTPEHAGSQWHAQQRRIDAANTIMFSSIDKTLKKIIAQPELSSVITKARHNAVGSRFLGIDYDLVYDLIERGCFEFTYKVLSEMERWILTICGMPIELHDTFMCTAQPRIALDAGDLNEDGQRWQEDLRDLRQKAISSIWHRYLFDEEFTEDDRPSFIVRPHLSRPEYKKSVFDALVRMTYDDNTCDTLAVQRSLTVQRKVSMTDMSFVHAYPLVVYDAHTGEPLDCEQAFREE